MTENKPKSSRSRGRSKPILAAAVTAVVAAAVAATLLPGNAAGATRPAHAAAATPSAGDPSGAAAARAATYAAAHATSLAWGACPTGTPAPQQCARIEVPLDYAAPHGRAIGIEISRVPARKPAERKGVLVLNGGGPGSSLDVPTLMGGLLPDQVRDRYDLVAFDPRGIGHSTPMTCGRDAGELVREEQLEVLSFPAANGDISRNVAFARQTAARCAAHSGDLLPYLTTANIARDIDRIRQALGERTVSYYGISWGTYLGAVYRTLFPQEIDRMVIDSSVDPGKRGYDDFRTFSAAMEDRWPDLARFAVAHQDLLHFGGTPAQVRRTYLRLTAALDRRPVTVAGTATPVDGNLARLFTWQLSYNDASMIPTDDAPVPPLAQLWRAAADLAAGRGTAADRAYVVGLTNDFVAGGTLDGVPQDNLFTVGWAISCGDQAWPRDTALYRRNVAADRAAYPLTAGAPANIAPCSAWAVRPTAPEPKVRPLGKRNVLILQNLRDPATPLAGARAMRRAMGDDAVMVEVDAGGHGVLVHPHPSACAIGALSAYFVSGALPDRDTRCAA
ncbi:alpha/beta hydrolase [Actinacidiphila sp. DG2A-62]|uniref:alpha/beta hydrolase n=1 Tax=Actinacidiphila sp. DG2A-62 TaxID=3108821 RepID=UPI002DBFEDDC|nr:alpha/beta hydrolase [Actinacidiphila sp. DG2A-62]MEC3992382.1 alpha/beta hydrolase [Actinacidiphila sp. DG2A-62]